MDRQLLDTYGYRDKPVSLCLETCYPATSPGNVPMRKVCQELGFTFHGESGAVKVLRITN